MHTPPISDSFPLVTWLPAELNECKSGWYISYYILNPETNQLVRKQMRWNRGKNITIRRKRGKEMCRKLNRKLEMGWNPIIEQEAPRSFEKLWDALEKFEKYRQKQFQKGAIAEDSLRTYSSYIKNFRLWLIDHKLENCLAFTFNKNLAREFLDEIYLERDNSPRTHNNYLSFLRMLGIWMVQRDYIKANPAEGIPKEKEGPKRRTVIPDEILGQIFNHLSVESPRFNLMCHLIYGCMIRRTELTKLKVEDIHLAHRVVMLPATSSKNNMEQPVTLPEQVLYLLVEHLKNAQPGQYVFSEPHLKPGRKRLSPKKVSDLWNLKVRKQLSLPKQYQFYSLKDTGITNLLEAGISPIKVRDQARHADLKETNKYTPRVKNAAVQEIAQINLPGWGAVENDGFQNFFISN